MCWILRHAVIGAVAALVVLACGPVERPPARQRITMAALPSPSGAGSAEPFVSATSHGELILSWLEREPASSMTRLRVATMDGAGAWGTPSDVVSASDLFVNWADFPSVAVLASGRLLAHWLQKNGSGKYAYDVRLSESADVGRSWSESVLAHEPNVPAEHGFVTLLPRPDSSADIVFLSGSAPPDTGHGKSVEAEGHGPPMRLALAHWRGSRVVGMPEILDTRTCDCCQTAAALTSRGPVILYRDRSDAEMRDISVQRHVNGAWTSAVPLHADGWVIDACPVNGPAISAQGENVVAAWFTGAQDTARVLLAFSTDAGATFGPPMRIDAGAPNGRVDVELLSDGDAIVTWIERTGPEGSEVRARLARRESGLEPPLTIVKVAKGRATGFPRMARRQNDVVLAWTMAGSPSTIQLASLRIAGR